MTTDTIEIPADLITLKEAARLARNCHKNTILRWVLSGRLPAWRIGSGRMYYVSRADVLALFQPVEVDPNKVKGVGPSRLQAERADREAAAKLKAMGWG